MKKQKKINKKLNFRLWIVIIIASICFSTLIISLINILCWSKDNKKTQNTIDEINELVNIETNEDTEETELINEPLDFNSDYWYYITFPLMNVDLKELKNKNSDTIGWINVNNTNINYPIVHYSDNDYYLNHSYDKSYNQAGWIYLDYRNNPNLTDRNNIIYGHYREDKTMFGSLLNVLDYSWYTNKDNHIIRISTETENTLWQIISVYKTPIESYYITVNFKNNDDYQTFLDTITKRSIHDFNTEINTEDKILTLSTCYSKDIRTVVHAKLIKKETKTN